MEASKSEKIGYFYFATSATLARLAQSIIDQIAINKYRSGTTEGLSFLVCDVKSSQLPVELCAYFSGRTITCDPSVVDCHGQSRFSYSKLRNVAIHHARTLTLDWLAFCDADTVVVDGSMKVGNTHFRVPNVYWQKSAEESLAVSVKAVESGDSSVFSPANSWFILGKCVFDNFTFNENMYGYGYEDINFFERLRVGNHQLERVDSSIIHKFHSYDEKRVVASEFSRNRDIRDADLVMWETCPEARWEDSVVYLLDEANGMRSFVYYPRQNTIIDPQSKQRAHPLFEGDTMLIIWDQLQGEQRYSIDAGCSSKEYQIKLV